MSKALVVCPATNELELIDYFDSPLGPLIHACSKFRPATALGCARACASCTRTPLDSSKGAFETDEIAEEVGADTDVDIAVDTEAGLERCGTCR